MNIISIILLIICIILAIIQVIIIYNLIRAQKGWDVLIKKFVDLNQPFYENQNIITKRLRDEINRLQAVSEEIKDSEMVRNTKILNTESSNILGRFRRLMIEIQSHERKQNVVQLKVHRKNEDDEQTEKE